MMGNKVKGINMALINAEVSTNPYRYGGKEWLMQEGLNYYDFAARQYDPTTGRFIHPDPLNGKYPHLSSYLYCAGNPINATDPSGMEFIIDKLSPEEKAKFETISIPSNDIEPVPEIVALYNMIANAPEVFVVEYVEKIEDKTVDGKIQNVPMKVSPSDNDKYDYKLSISKTSPPQIFAVAEDMFHCYQHCNLSGYEGKHNLEYEAKLFAHFIMTVNGVCMTYNLPFYSSVLSFLGIQVQYGYPSDFNQKLSDKEFIPFYIQQSELFVDYNNKNDIGNSNYRTETKSPPYSLLKFYNDYKTNR